MSLPITVLDIWQHSVYWIISKYLYYLERNSKMRKNLFFIYESKISNFDYFWKKYIIFLKSWNFIPNEVSLSWSFTSLSIIFRLKIFYLSSRFLRSCTESCQILLLSKMENCCICAKCSPYFYSFCISALGFSCMKTFVQILTTCFGPAIISKLIFFNVPTLLFYDIHWQKKNHY